MYQHPTYVRLFQDYCLPLSQKISPQLIRYVRIHKEGGISVIANDTKILEWYFGEKCYRYGFNEKGLEHYSTGFALSDSWEKSEQVLEQITYPLATQFDVGSELVLYHKAEQHCDILEIGLPTQFKDANHYLMKHFRFINDFFEKLRNSPISDYFSQKKIYFQEQSEDNRIVICKEYSFAKLAPRELQCLYWLEHGKSMSEIGLILELSARTIELYIHNIKVKLSVHTNFQLGKKIGLASDHFITLFRELDAR